MSVTLTSIREVLHDEAFDGELKCAESFDISNIGFADILKKTPAVANWDGTHDPLCFSPVELVLMAAHNPEHSKILMALAADGGAILS